jgi:hypothetical protein
MTYKQNMNKVHCGQYDIQTELEQGSMWTI